MKRSPLTTPLRLTQVAITLGIVGLFGYSYMERRANAGLPTGIDAPPAAVRAIQYNMGIVALDLLNYMGDQDRDHLNGVKIAGKEIKHLLGVYADNDPSAASAQNLSQRYETLRAATITLLEFDASEKEERTALAQTAQTLSDVIKDKIRPTLRTNQLSAYARLQAVGQMEAEARALASQTSDASRFEKALASYEDFTRTRVGRRTSDQAEGLFQEGVSHSRALHQATTHKGDALQQFSDAYRRFGDALDSVAQTPMAMEAAPVHEKRFLLLPSLQGWVAALGFTVVLIFFLDRMTRRRMVQPLQALIQSAEAAATGDLTRTADLVTHDEMGRLTSAVQRLISVLSRSENLVYHLAALVEASGDAIIGHSLDGSILSWNKGAQRIYGYSADEVKGRSISLLAPESKDELKDIFKRIKRGERVQPFDMLHLAKNGRRVKAFVRVGAILDSTRQTIGVSLCAQEIPDAVLMPSAAPVDAPFTAPHPTL